MAKLHAGMVDHGFCVLALEQYGGKGQRGKKWVTEPGENITMSAVLYPAKLGQSRIVTFPFGLSAIIALACYDFIKGFQIAGISIKWPNDLYIGDRKAGGILIENTYNGATWNASVAGIGINLNQTRFLTEAARPVSLKMITGKGYNIIACGKALHRLILDRFSQLTDVDDIMKEYNQLLYRKGEKVKLRRDNITFDTVIDHVSVSGELITTEPVERRFKVGEVEFV